VKAWVLNRFYHRDALRKNHWLHDAVLARHCCLRMAQQRRKLFVHKSRFAKRISYPVSERVKIQIAPGRRQQNDPRPLQIALQCHR